ncbi:MAG: hypothetical protein M1836_007915 [Candelina mexicana]|nr:MAG: hypothetical protein M1836_007915 [Candelina mexicana]
MSHIPDILTSLAPYHIFAYGTLLGSQLYQSFILTKLNFRTLPAPHFNALNKKVFPIYFQLQTGLVVLTALTHPPLSLFSVWQRGWSESVPLSFALGMAVLNLRVWGPETERVRVERGRQGVCGSSTPHLYLVTHLGKGGGMSIYTDFTNSHVIRKETRDGRKYDDTEHQSEKMKKVNREFKRAHAMVIHLNAIAMLATVWYGVSLAGRIT